MCRLTERRELLILIGIDVFRREEMLVTRANIAKTRNRLSLFVV